MESRTSGRRHDAQRLACTPFGLREFGREPHRLAALVLEDLQRYPESAISDIHRRIGGEIHPKQVKRALEDLIGRDAVRFEGNKRWRRYWAES